MTAFESLHGDVSILMVPTKGGTKQVFPVDCEADVSQRLVEASYSGDVGEVVECLADPYVDVNFAGVVRLREWRTDVVLREEMADEILFENEEIRTEVSALFLAAHNGKRDLVRKLLVTSVLLKLTIRFFFSFLSFFFACKYFISFT